VVALLRESFEEHSGNTQGFRAANRESKNQLRVRVRVTKSVSSTIL